MEVKEFLDKISTAGDVAAAAIGYAAGFVADTYYFPGGLPPGTVAAVTAVGVVGIKKAFDALINLRRGKNKYEGDAASLEQRAEALSRYMRDRIESITNRLGEGNSVLELELSDEEKKAVVEIKRHFEKELAELVALREDLGVELSAWQNGIIDDSEFNRYLLYIAGECRKLVRLPAVKSSHPLLDWLSGK